MENKIFLTIDPKNKHFHCENEWTLIHLPHIELALSKVSVKEKELTLDGSAISKMDSAGAWLLQRWLYELSKKEVNVHLEHFSENHQKLLSLASTHVTAQLTHIRTMPNGVARIGRNTVEQWKEIKEFCSFIGYLALNSLRIGFDIGRLRLRSIMSVIEKTGFQALPIIALLSFMIGVVISYQMGNQLRKYGANVFIVDLLGLSVLREFGPLLTAIIVAGRTGSAFTAQLGIMKINQEIDAINTMGMTAAELLLLPRMLGLFIVLPL